MKTLVHAYTLSLRGLSLEGYEGKADFYAVAGYAFVQPSGQCSGTEQNIIQNIIVLSRRSFIQRPSGGFCFIHALCFFYFIRLCVTVAGPGRRWV